MKIRWGILGCGHIARRRVARAIQDDAHSELVAACRRNAATLREFCSDFQIKGAYTRDQELLADDTVDAVYIATPVHRHCPQTVAAAAAGKHVLCEKPMALSVAECDEMIGACRQHGVKLGVAYYRRFYPITRRMNELIAAGDIGDLLSVSVTCASRFALSPGDQGYWRVIPAQGGGGSLMDIGSHRIDLLLHMFGDVTDVKAYCYPVSAGYEPEDCASLIMRFDWGLQGSLQCVFGAPVDPDEFSVLGTKGRLLAAPLNGSRLMIDSGNQRREELHPPADNLTTPLIADFVAAIHQDRVPAVSGEEGRRTNAVIERAYREADVGPVPRPVRSER